MRPSISIPLLLAAGLWLSACGKKPAAAPVPPAPPRTAGQQGQDAAAPPPPNSKEAFAASGEIPPPPAPTIAPPRAAEALSRLMVDDAPGANPARTADATNGEQANLDAQAYGRCLADFQAALAAHDAAKADELLAALVENASRGTSFDRHILRQTLRELTRH